MDTLLEDVPLLLHQVSPCCISNRKKDWGPWATTVGGSMFVHEIKGLKTAISGNCSPAFPCNKLFDKINKTDNKPSVGAGAPSSGGLEAGRGPRRATTCLLSPSSFWKVPPISQMQMESQEQRGPVMQSTEISLPGRGKLGQRAKPATTLD